MGLVCIDCIVSPRVKVKVTVSKLEKQLKLNSFSYRTHIVAKLGMQKEFIKRFDGIVFGAPRVKIAVTKNRKNGYG